MSEHRTLYVDPGIRGSGAALFDASNQLIAAAYVKNPEREGNGPAECVSMARAIVEWSKLGWVQPRKLSRLAVEWPRIYTAGKLQGDPNDLAGLVGVDCALAGILSIPVKRYFPDEWKGQTPKDVMNARVLERLTEAEKTRITSPPSLLHNVLDAIGIGLHDLGRLTRQRVFPGEGE